MADAVTKWQYGTQDTVGTWSTDVADDAFSSESSEYNSTAPTNGHENYPMAEAVLDCGDGFGAGTYVTSPVINLYARQKDIDGTNDANVPDSNYPSRLVCQFIVDKGVTTRQYLPGGNDVRLYEKQTYYLENKTGKVLEADGGNGLTLKMTPKGIVGDTT